VAGAFYNQVVLAICHMKVVTFYPLEEEVHGQMVEVTGDLVVAPLVHVIIFGITDLRITY
jgi:hypothetical protein